MAPPLAVFLLHLWFIPRISGSRARATRVSASDIDPLSQLNHTVSGNSTYTFLSAISPGLFLDLQISRHTSLVKVYGHKRAGASLYGVHLAYGGGSFEIVDGYDPSISNVLGAQPSCIFSLSIDPREDISLGLYNLYDRRFGEYGVITFSFAEYIPQDEASDVHAQMCGHHIDSFNNASALLPRDGDASISTNPSQPHPVIGTRVNIIIGLLTALIVIVLAIFVVFAIYVLPLRRQAVLRRSKKDSEAKSEENQNDPFDKSITLTSVTAAETLQPRIQGQIYNDRCFEQPQSTIYTDPTSSLPPRSEITKPNPISQWRPRNDPPTSPPKEPIPEVPKVPLPPPTLQTVRSKGELLQKPPTLPNTQYTGHTRIQDTWSIPGNTAYPVNPTIDSLSPVCLAEPAQVRNPDNMTKHQALLFRPNDYHHSRFPKPLPELVPGNSPPSLSPINHIIINSPQSNGSSNDPPMYIEPGRLHTRIHNEMPTIREPSTTHMDIDGSNGLPAHSTLEYTGSLDNEARSLHQDQSKISLEHGTAIMASDRKDTASLQDRGRPKQTIQSNQHTRLTLAQKHPQPDNTIQKTRLSVSLPDDPEEWLLFLRHQEELDEPVKNIDRIQTEAQQTRPLRISEADASIRRARRSARVEYQEMTSSPKQDPSAQIHSPRRALPKPPF